MKGLVSRRTKRLGPRFFSLEVSTLARSSSYARNRQARLVHSRFAGIIGSVSSSFAVSKTKVREQ